MILFFRGKAATGKTTLASILNDKYGYQVMSKDTIFDKLLNQGVEWAEANSITHEKLADEIQRKYDFNSNLIVDIGLSHTPYFIEFFNKMDLNPSKVKLFLFTCSNDEVWSKRMQERIISPEGPNQAFESVQQAFEHYGKYTIEPLSNEVVIDSALSLDIMLNEVIL